MCVRLREKESTMEERRGRKMKKKYECENRTAGKRLSKFTPSYGQTLKMAVPVQTSLSEVGLGCRALSARGGTEGAQPGASVGEGRGQ